MTNTNQLSDIPLLAGLLQIESYSSSARIDNSSLETWRVGLNLGSANSRIEEGNSTYSRSKSA